MSCAFQLLMQHVQRNAIVELGFSPGQPKDHRTNVRFRIGKAMIKLAEP